MKKFKTNKLLKLALDYSYEVMDEKKVDATDMTEAFFDECVKVVQNKELLNININGPVAKGKSTVGMAICDHVLMKCYNRHMEVQDLARDQEEFIEMMKDPDTGDTVIVIDEWNELENTGENVTVEQALFQYLSDVQAQRFIHKISCSPSEAPDKNADIYLEVVQPDKHTKTTHCRLIYKFVKGGSALTQTLGFVNVDVSYILEQKWYHEYRRRKFEKMDLIIKEGIFRPREMKYARVILKVEAKIRPLARTGNISQDTTRGFVEHYFRKMKLPHSIPGIELSTKRVYGMMRLWRTYFGLMRQQSVMLEQKRKGTIREELSVFNERLKAKKEETNILNEAITTLRESYQALSDMKEKYDTVQT